MSSELYPVGAGLTKESEHFAVVLPRGPGAGTGAADRIGCADGGVNSVARGGDEAFGFEALSCRGKEFLGLGQVLADVMRAHRLRSRRLRHRYN
jgi:hypothetical protein